MAESVVKLRLDSGEYDSKIKRAAQNVLSFGENCQKAGQSVAKADKETLDYVRSIGQMETVAKNTKGKINEMTTAFTDLSVQYKNLTDEEKKSQFGVALSQSLDQLKTRIGESKAQLTEVNAELGNTSKQSDETGGVLDALAGKFGLNINQAGAFGIALGVTTTAAKVAKDAFFSNEEQLDEWGRVVASSESVYRGFLDAINTGDISGFLTRMDSIVAAARQAYDALDELATYNAFNQVNVARARQAFMDAQNNYREGTGSKEQVRSAGNAMKGELDQRRDLEKKAYSAEIVRLAKERDVNPVDLARVMLGTYGDYKKIKSMPLTGTRTETLTTQYGMPYQRTWTVAANEMERMGSMLRRFNDTELQKLQGLGAQFFNTGFEKGQIDRQVNRILNGRQGGASGGSGGGGGGGRTGGGGGGGANTPPPPPEGSIAAQEAKVQALTKAWREATDEVGRAGYAGMLEEAKQVLDQMQGKTKEVIPEGSFKDLKNQLGDLQKQRELLADPVDIAIIDQDIERIKEKIDTLNGVMKQGSTPMSLEDKIRTNLADSITAVDENTLTNLLEFKIKNGLDNLDINSDYLKQAIFGERIDISDDYWQDLAERINEQLASMGIEPITIDVKTGEVVQAAKKAKDGWQDAAQAVQAVSGALQQLEDPGAKIMGIIGEAIANIALGFAQATASDSKLGVFGWIAAIAGGLGTMISTISAIKSATAGSYAEGGIIPGNNYNDGLIANVSSGELILNRAQQNSIASQLTTNTVNGESRPYVDVEKIWLGLGHYLKRKGMGEIVTTR